MKCDDYAGETEWLAVLHFRIHDICHNSTRLKEVIMRDLLPSSSMVRDLSQEFGIPISQEELTDAKLLAPSPQPTPNDGNIQRQTSTLPEEIQTHQEKYLQWRNNMLLKNQVRRESLVQVGVLPSLQAEAPLFSAASSTQ